MRTQKFHFLYKTSRSIIAAVLLFVSTLGLASTTQNSGDLSMMTLTSAFQEGETIPSQYTCEGKNISPPLDWHNQPNKTQSLVLIFDDPDAPNGTWYHWILFNIPANINSLPENVSKLPDGAEQGLNSWGKTGYGGPCPPTGEHRYVFKLYALDAQLPLQSGADRRSVEAAMEGHILQQATLIGKYKKS